MRSILVMTLALVAAPARGQTPDFKIGLVTGTVSQGEDEFRAAQMIKDRYPDLITHVTYPDNFMQEQETTITQIQDLAMDPDNQAVVIAQAIPGSVPALKKVRDLRPDFVFAFIEPHEDPQLVNGLADLVLQSDQVKRGRTVVELAKRMGATKFLHYSFPRHMAMPLLNKRRDLMKETAGRLGMEFLFVTAPDPMGEGGIPASQQFVLEDVPRKVAEHGPSIAVFSTNCAMQEPMIQSALKTGAYFPEQCCPSPTHAYPGALGISIPEDKAGDIGYIIEQVEKSLVERNGAGRFATWPVPSNILMTKVAVEMLIKVLGGETKIDDVATLQALFEKEAGSHPIELTRFDESSGNFYQVLSGSIIFGKRDAPPAAGEAVSPGAGGAAVAPAPGEAPAANE